MPGKQKVLRFVCLGNNPGDLNVSPCPVQGPEHEFSSDEEKHEATKAAESEAASHVEEFHPGGAAYQVTEQFADGSTGTEDSSSSESS